MRARIKGSSKSPRISKVNVKYSLNLRRPTRLCHCFVLKLVKELFNMRFFEANEIIKNYSRYLDDKTCLSASGAGAAGVSAALSVAPYKMIMSMLAQRGEKLDAH